MIVKNKIYADNTQIKVSYKNVNHNNNKVNYW